jgi:hypothetical protein
MRSSLKKGRHDHDRTQHALGLRPTPVRPGDVEQPAALLDAQLTAERARTDDKPSPGTVAALRHPVDIAGPRK